MKTCVLSLVRQGSGLGMLAVAALPAFAQTPGPLTNPSFEIPRSGSVLNIPRGWTNAGDTNEVKRRYVGDGLQPPIQPVGTPNAITPRTGEALVEIRAPGDGGFRSVNTDIVNTTLPTFPFYDPFFDWEGGSVRVGVWYLIPANAPLEGGGEAAVKLNVKFGNQDYATSDPWGETGLFVGAGTTNGEWRFAEYLWTRTAIRREVFFNEAQGFFVLPPFPDHFKIVVGYWGRGFAGDTGTIYYDDVFFEQYAAADFNADGQCDFFDYLDFASAFGNEEEPADFNGDGQVDFFDYLDFAQAFGAC
ncbi:MAG: hypothetical protein SFZ23_03695 [Planctomycetota bacterium]|nr:hypothetical protein [Planctomycetota bacterium]